MSPCICLQRGYSSTFMLDLVAFGFDYEGSESLADPVISTYTLFPVIFITGNSALA